MEKFLFTASQHNLVLGLSQNVFIFEWIYICIFPWLFYNLTALSVHIVLASQHFQTL